MQAGYVTPPGELKLFTCQRVLCTALCIAESPRAGYIAGMRRSDPLLGEYRL
jgi:hypothetical protein